MQLKEQSKTRKRTELYNAIKEAIVFGEYSQGAKIVEFDLIDKYNVSRYAIREVFKRLDNEGYLEIVPNKGVTVRKISAEETEEIYTLLILLEEKAAEAAASMIDSKQSNMLKKIYNDMVAMRKKSPYVEWMRCNLKLHCFISNICGWKFLPELIEDLRSRIYRGRFALAIVDSRKEYDDQHKKIIDSIISKNPKLAAKYMKLHLETAKRNRIAFMKNFPIT